MSTRESGYYWVKFHREPDVWLVARWDAGQSWWVTEATMELPHGIVCGDGRWSVIGPRIPTPDEVAPYPVQHHDSTRDNLRKARVPGIRGDAF